MKLDFRIAGLSSVLALMLVPTLVNSALADQTAPVDCSASFDVYKVSVAVLQGCGFRTFPLQATQPLSDGGAEYVYIADGLKTVYPVPPAGLDLASATDEQLSLYGLPARPSDALALAEWRSEMGRLHILPPPPFLVEIRARADITATNWSGYVAQSASSTAYTQAEIKYNEPQALSTPCANNSATTFAGLGGFSNKLAQDGTGINTPGLGQHQAWSEVLPDQSGIRPQQLYGHAGYAFIAEVNRLGSGGGFNFYMHDTYSGSGVVFQVSSNNYDGRNADFIVERPYYGGSPRNLTNYSYINVLDAWVNGTAPSNGVGNYTHSAVNMYNGPDLLAYPGALSNSGQTFTDYYVACS